jgi:hypothetical protein
MPLPKIFYGAFIPSKLRPSRFPMPPGATCGHGRIIKHLHARTDWQLLTAGRSVADQQAYVRRMIVCGAPTQAAEDRLLQLEQTLLQLCAATAPPLSAGRPMPTFCLRQGRRRSDAAL